MQIEKSETLPIRIESNVVEVRQIVRKWAMELKFTLTEQTKVVTAASEIARNTLVYGKGGDFTLALISDRGRQGLRLVFADQGPGIADVETALRDGYTSGGGLGLGLGGSKRLVHEFDITSNAGVGTKITLIRWK